MGDIVQVDPSALSQHAGEVRQFMGQLSSATASAGTLFDPQAFGIVCQAFTGILQVWIGAASSAIDQVVVAGGEVADAVDDMATAYSTNDSDMKAQFDAILNGIGDGS